MKIPVNEKEVEVPTEVIEVPSLPGVIKGRQVRPPRICIYGVQGIGKSSLASYFPKPIFLNLEDGLDGIDCESFPVSRNLGDIIGTLKLLETEKHSYKTLIVDSIDWCEKVLHEHVAALNNVRDVGEISFGKGYAQSLALWCDLLRLFDALRDRGMIIILVAHSKITRFEDPMQSSYDRFCLDLRDKVASMISEWCDAIFFMNYKVYTRKVGEAFGQEIVKATGVGERVLHTQERPSFVAKNRYQLPEEIIAPNNQQELINLLRKIKGE